jgi:hypothetical protein
MKLTTKIAIGLAATLLPAGAKLIAQGAFTMGGESYGASIQTSTVSLPKTPVATLTWAGLAHADTTGVTVSGLIDVANTTNYTTAAGDPGNAAAQTTSSTEHISLLGGLITADGVSAVSASMIDATGASSTALGSGFYNLVVAGLPVSASVAPNTIMNLPGVGSVTLNEQIATGDGVNSTALRVNMVHVQTRNPLTGAVTGDIIVGSAESHLSQ